MISQFWELSNAGGSIKRLLRPVQLLLALHCFEIVHVNIYADLRGAILEGANLYNTRLQGAKNVPELSAKQEEDACWSDCG